MRGRLEDYGIEISRGLWQGPKPPPGPALAQAGYQALVLSAVEFQPPERVFASRSSGASLRAICRVPLYDAALEPDSALGASHAAEWVVDQLQQGRQTLVSCWAGHNRSGLISALVVHYITGASGAKAVQFVQSKIPEALSNDSFMRFLWSIKPCEPILPAWRRPGPY